MPDPQVGSSTAGNNSQPLFNGQAPKQPKALPLVFNFVAQQVYNVDLSVQQAFNTIDLVQSLFIDNSTGTAPIVVTCPVTRQSIQCPPKSQGYFAFLQTIPIQFTVASNGGQTAAIIELLNFPVASLVWSIGSAAFSFNGAGALQVSDTLLEALIANGGLTVTTQPGFNYVIFEGQKRTYSAVFGAFNVSATGSFLQIVGAANPVITRVRRIYIWGVSSTAADSARIDVARRSTANATVGTTVLPAQHDTNDAAAGAVVKQIAAPGVAGTLVSFLRTYEIGLPLVTANNGGNELEILFGTANDEAFVLRGNAQYLTVDLTTASGAYANNIIGFAIEWTEE